MISNIQPPVSKTEITHIFSLQQIYWKNNHKIKVFVFPDDHPLHQQFCKDITNIYPHRYRRIWDRLTFSGTGVAPTTVYSRKEMLEKVSQTENAIGYIDIMVNVNNVKFIELDHPLEVVNE